MNTADASADTSHMHDPGRKPQTGRRFQPRPAPLVGRLLGDDSIDADIVGQDGHLGEDLALEGHGHQGRIGTRPRNRRS